MGPSFQNPQHLPAERTETLSDETGFALTLKEISLENITFRWGSYTNPSEKQLLLQPTRESIVTHFLLQGSEPAANNRGNMQTRGNMGNPAGLMEKQFVVFREPRAPYEIPVAPTHGNRQKFFELSISDHQFVKLLDAESPFLRSFEKFHQPNTLLPSFTASITPQMIALIGEIHQAPYQGRLQSLFLEAKWTELFLQLIHQLDNRPPGSSLNTADRERLEYIRSYLSQHYMEDLSILSLAKEAGINQTKLKQGFKELFHTTVFGHIHELRLTEARRLLLEENKYVSEVAWLVGYKYPHHFTASFKKRFGILPAELRSRY